MTYTLLSAVMLFIGFFAGRKFERTAHERIVSGVMDRSREIRHPHLARRGSARRAKAIGLMEPPETPREPSYMERRQR